MYFFDFEQKSTFKLERGISVLV